MGLDEIASPQPRAVSLELVAWCSGFIDGEGSIRLVPNARTYAPCIEATQATHREPLDRLQLTLGGVVTLQARRTVSNKPVYRWVWKSANQMRVLLPDLIKYMTAKRDQAEVLLTYVNSMSGRGGANRLSSEIVEWRHAQRLLLIEMKRG